MANKEIHIPIETIRDPQTITAVNKKLIAENDMDIHKNEVVKLEDDHTLGKRVIRLRKVKYFGPWSHRG